MTSHTPPSKCPSGAPESARHHAYTLIDEALAALLEGEDDWIAALATVSCELHHAFEYFHWTGVYRAHPDGRPELIIGPYQGGHGCLRIDFARGVCGAAARERVIQLVPDVHAFPGHIACSSTTRSEVVVPILTPDGALLGVLDVDSDLPAAFTAVDAARLGSICAMLGRRFAHVAPAGQGVARG